MLAHMQFNISPFLPADLTGGLMRAQSLCSSAGMDPPLGFVLMTGRLTSSTFLFSQMTSTGIFSNIPVLRIGASGKG